MDTYCVGLDVHKSRTTFVIEGGSGVVVRRGEFATTKEGIAAWVRQSALPSGTPMALETGTLAFFVSDELTGAGLAPHVIGTGVSGWSRYRGNPRLCPACA